MELSELERKVAALQMEIAELKRRATESEIVYFEHTQAYYRPERKAWIARWNSTPYRQAHIKQCASKQEAVEVALRHNDTAKFVLAANETA